MPTRSTTQKPVVYEGMQTPWGRADSANVIIDGIGWVGTPGHGGCKLDRKHNALIPEYMRKDGGWYEEDCDWAIPFVIFEEKLREFGDEHTKKSIAEGKHWHTFKNWHWKECEQLTGQILSEDESFEKANDLFSIRNKANWVGVSAVGDWSDGVPKGFVEVTATMGGERKSGIEQRIFHIPEAEYDARGKFSYVIPNGMTPVRTKIW